MRAYRQPGTYERRGALGGLIAMSANFFYSLENPLDAIPGEKQMRTANFTGFASLVRSLGGDPRRVLEHHGIDPQAIRDPDSYLECQSLVDVFEHCSSAFNEPLFGLRLAQYQDADVFGCVTALCRAAPTFRDAVRAFIDYIPVVHSPLTMMELLEGNEIAELRWWVRKDLGTNQQAHYQAALLDTNLLRAVGGRAFRPSYVSLTVDTRLKDVSEIESKLGCRYRSRAQANAIAFPTAMLDQPIPSSNRLLYRLLGGYLERVGVASRKSIVERVQDYVHGALSSGTCSIEHCAQKLGTSVRTLQSHLSDSGLRFSDILEKQRMELAKTYLEQAQLSLDEVAALLGYSEQSSFGRAFKRWTGSTPQRFRALRGMTQMH
jgi:AraC-like DNA-binding protein